MSLTSGFFDAMEQGEGNYDRVYTAAEFAHYFSLLVGNGVFPSPDTGLNVLASDPASMTVKIGDGSGWINGYFVTVAGGHSVTLEAASGAGTRIDSIIMQWNSNDRKINIIAKSGTASGDPKPVDLQRDAELWELELAQITVGAGVSSVDQTNIKDMRADSDRCGLVTALLKGIDPSTFLKQSEAEFNQWFSTLMNKISSEDVAGSLLKMITEVDNRSKETESLVKNISVVDISKVGDMLLSARSLKDNRLLLCDGSVLSNKVYNELFNEIGFLFGGAYSSSEYTYSGGEYFLATSPSRVFSVKLSESVYFLWSYDSSGHYIRSCIYEADKKALKSQQVVNLSGGSYASFVNICIYGNYYRVSSNYTYKSRYTHYIVAGNITSGGLSNTSSPQEVSGTLVDEITTPVGILSVEYSSTNDVTAVKLYRANDSITQYTVPLGMKVKPYSSYFSYPVQYPYCVHKGKVFVNIVGNMCILDGNTLTLVSSITDTVRDILSIGDKLFISMMSKDAKPSLYTYDPDTNSVSLIQNINYNHLLHKYDESTLVFQDVMDSDGYVYTLHCNVITVKDGVIKKYLADKNPLIPNKYPEPSQKYITPATLDTLGKVLNEWITPYHISNSGGYSLNLHLFKSNMDKFCIPYLIAEKISECTTSSGYYKYFDVYNPICYIKVKE